MDTEETKADFTAAEKQTASRVIEGMQLAQSGQFQGAKEAFEAILEATPDEPDALHYYAIVLYQLGDTDQALLAVQKSLKSFGDNPHALNTLGNFLKLQGQFDDAAEAYNRAIQFDPNNPQCLNNLANIQRNQGKHELAIETLRRAVAIDPQLAEAQYNLANLYSGMGKRWEALNAYRDCFALGGNWQDPVFYAKLMVATDHVEEATDMLVNFLKFHPDHEGAQFQLAAMRGDKVDGASASYVTKLFDKHAESFDSSLKLLDYRAPEYVAQAVIDRLGPPAGNKTILDLGCGTGLCGPLIAGYKEKMVGIDLSPRMLRQAAKLDCYDDLEVAELQQYLSDHPKESVDVVICADTLVYLGALERTFSGVHKVLKPGGFFVASVEKLEDPNEDFVLGISSRFKHSRPYLERLASDNNLSVSDISDVILRTEMGEPVYGYVVEYMRPA